VAASATACVTVTTGSVGQARVSAAPAAGRVTKIHIAEAGECRPLSLDVSLVITGLGAQLMEALVAGRRPDRPVPPMAGTAAIGAVVHLPATAIEEGRDLSSMSGILADSSCRVLPA
jgi:hypothetical protein